MQFEILRINLNILLSSNEIPDKKSSFPTANPKTEN